MKNFVKNYIGKGKKVEGLEIIKINFKIEDLVKFSHKYKDENYITIEIAKLKSPDKFGHDYTAYVKTLEDSSDAGKYESQDPQYNNHIAKNPASEDVPLKDLPF